MTYKLKCPFCGAELKRSVFMTASCPNENCKIPECKLPIYIWDVLIDGKKAQDALNEATKCISWTIDTIYRGLDREADIVGCCELSLERINEITKQEC